MAVLIGSCRCGYLSSPGVLRRRHPPLLLPSILPDLLSELPKLPCPPIAAMVAGGFLLHWRRVVPPLRFPRQTKVPCGPVSLPIPSSRRRRPCGSVLKIQSPPLLLTTTSHRSPVPSPVLVMLHTGAAPPAGSTGALAST
ncbi:uncharacterized protein LOC123439847 [Hordeum vulgare subsp. vulgare]|uniref:uncharacterized protein LOC123439847 n=1 Tax=Hordeum vulgare subsp. vulgare TaxID=112509 RepID=UPI001D1A3719|nr:uncharacterized protein LOC123439847 [Hordeum vulgare subsp. vulgare]